MSINKLNQLIEALVNPNKEQDNKNLLFLFIDDIDLSTYRCADVVKTLLSYLSNENIVTIISGDLDTFEEALTLDFLRRDNVLTAVATVTDDNAAGEQSGKSMC